MQLLDRDIEQGRVHHSLPLESSRVLKKSAKQQERRRNRLRHDGKPITYGPWLCLFHHPH
jgi:hypothetical protein